MTKVQTRALHLGSVRDLTVKIGIARFLQFATFFFGLASVVLLFLGLHQIAYKSSEEADRAELVVHEPVKSVGDLPAGTDVTLLFTLTNASSHPIRLVGAGDTCVTWGCLEAKNLPLKIATNGSNDLKINLRTAPRDFSGPFDGEIVVFTDSHVTKRFALRVTGRIVPGILDR